jgi:hypothetical protein
VQQVSAGNCNQKITIAMRLRNVLQSDDYVLLQSDDYVMYRNQMITYCIAVVPPGMCHGHANVTLLTGCDVSLFSQAAMCHSSHRL